ncbi:class I adenylate-forming enzyme family protein [Paenibacillus kobensis]|uniref:class I adenylate-forming enzyme family protein n=1 Tax=Paenibacillus kobensis TaxID=59841 RepID=UPI0013E3CEE2|nr:class I adenylate-forming enzyme family protein [Paenibacillus kobensis]
MNDISTLRELFHRARRHDRGITYAARNGESDWISYAEWGTRMDLLAERLKQERLRPKFIGAVWMAPTPECLAVIGAVLLAGGIPLPIHSYMPGPDVLRLIRKFEPEAVFVSEDKLPTLEEWNMQGEELPFYLYAGMASGPIRGIGTAPRPVRRYTPPEATRMIFLSSGSTGEPKGIMLSDRNMLSNVNGILHYTSLCDEDTVLLSKSLGYCSTIVGEWFAAMACGANLILSGGFVHPFEMIRCVRSNKVTFLCTVPSAILPLIHSAKWVAEDLLPLRHLLIVGGPMPAGMLLRLADRLPHVRLMPSYGLTEASPRVSYLPYAQLRTKPQSAGIPLNGVELAIVQDGREVATGESGEVVVRGPNVMIGYYDDPDRTSEVLGPLGLHTRDTGYLDEDGYLHLTGRTDNALLVGGHTVHPEAVESVILSLPGVVDVAVSAVEDLQWGHRLIAVVVSETSTEPVSDSELHAWCVKRLSSALRPREFRFVTALPRTASGKLDRKALKSMVKEEDHVHRA